MLERFKEIFDGLRTAYGKTTATGEKREKDGKVLTKNIILREEPTAALYQKHLDGIEPALGIIPINEESNCKWGCVDIDQYNLNLVEINNKVKDFPCILFRSKSGGGHLFIFTKEWVPAEILRNKLIMLKSYIGHGGAEVIPKQNKKRSEKSVGSYLNLPYLGGDRTTRYAFGPNGDALSLEEFFKYYDQKAITLSELKDFVIDLDEGNDKDDFHGMPPCLKTLLAQKVTEGGRNNVMLHLGIYLKKRFDKKFKGEMNAYNKKYFQPTLEDDEIDTLAEQVEKDYKYTCSAEPMHSYCDAGRCSLAEFGVGDDIPGVVPEQVELYESDPPIYTVTIGGEEVICDGETLWNPDRFGTEAMNKAKIIMDVISKPIWRRMLKKIFNSDKFSTTQPPESAKLDYQLQTALEKYVMGAPGKKIEDVNKSKSYTEDGILYFKFDNFWRSLVRSKVWPERTLTKIKTQKMFCEQFQAEEKPKKVGTKAVRLIHMKAIDFEKPIVRKNEKKKQPYE